VTRQGRRIWKLPLPASSLSRGDVLAGCCPLTEKYALGEWVGDDVEEISYCRDSLSESKSKANVPPMLRYAAGGRSSPFTGGERRRHYQRQRDTTSDPSVRAQKFRYGMKEIRFFTRFGDFSSLKCFACRSSFICRQN